MPEKQNIEWKSKWKDEYLAWLCGFANAQGGVLYLGMDDHGEVIGLSNAGKLMERFEELAHDDLNGRGGFRGFVGHKIPPSGKLDLYAKMRANIKEYENFIENPYLDTKGYITTGYGANINNKEDFMKVNFMINGKPATDAEKEQYYYHLRDMSMLVDENNKFVYHNTKAENFAKSTPLRISQEDALNMAQNHMNNDLAQVRREFADFDNLPIPLKEVLLDIQYNVKGGIQKANWPKLYQAIADKDINEIAANVHRKDVQKERNDWAERMARSIRF